MNDIRKSLCLIVAILLLLLASCGNAEPAATTNPTVPTVSVSISEPTTQPAAETTSKPTVEPTAEVTTFPTSASVTAPEMEATATQATIPMIEATVAPATEPVTESDQNTPSKDCSHSYEVTENGKPTCTTAGYTKYQCSRCGHSYTLTTAKADHDYADATCTQPKRCKICGAAEGQSKGHSYELTVTAPTCTQRGYTTHSCVSCGNSYKSHQVYALGHTYEAVTTAPTCTDYGYTTKTCTVCGDVDVTDYVPPLGHSWKQATCTTPKVCTACNFVEGNATGHTWKVVSCESNMVCSICGAVGEYQEHNWTPTGCCGDCSITWCGFYGHSFGSRIRCQVSWCGEYDEEIVKLVTDILGDIFTENMSEYDKVRAIHDYIVDNTRYDYENYVNDTIPDVSYTARGSLQYGTAVCGGYAETFDLLCEFAGIASETVIGITINPAGVPEDHAWNQVRIDGKWYNVDVTWDDPVSTVDIRRYDYFLISDAEMYQDHAAYDAVHICDASYPRDQILD